MRRYEQVSGALFAFIALVQLTRSVLGWPITVGNTSIPIWGSIVALLVTGSMAIWAFRAAKSPV